MSQPDLPTITQIQKQVWGAGDFARIASVAQFIGGRHVENLDVMSNEKVLDIACGSGNIAIAAARRFADVTGLDYVPSLLETARRRAESEGFPEIEWVEGDAQDLPFEDASFDVVLSVWGVMLAPDQQKAADELVRVCRPGGRIGLGNWTPDSVVGQMAALAVKHAPPPVQVDPPVLWGTEERLRELFGDRISSLEINPRTYNFKGPSVSEYLDWFTAWFGPMKMAYERLGEDGFGPLREEMEELFTRCDVGDGRGMKVPAEFVEVVAVRA